MIMNSNKLGLVVKHNVCKLKQVLMLSEMIGKIKIITRSLIIIAILLSSILGLAKESLSANLDATQKLEQIKNTIANLPKNFSNETIENLISQCKDIITTDTNNVDVYICLSTCYYLKNDIDRGIEATDKILSLDSKNTHGYFLKGFGYYGKGLKEKDINKRENYLDAAILNLNKTLSLNPNYESIKVQVQVIDASQILLNMGVCYKLKRDLVKAKETFQIILDK